MRLRILNQIITPIIGGKSLSGLFAGKTNTSFPAVVSGSISKAFKGKGVLSPVALSYEVNRKGNPISRATNYFEGRMPAENSGVDQALAEFDKYAASNNFEQKGLAQSKEKADALIKAGVDIFKVQWDSTYAKYLGLVREAIVGDNTDKFMDTVALPVPQGTTAQPDVRTQTSNSKYLDKKITDLRSIVKDTTTVKELASTFAAIEILITQNLTQVVTADLGILRGLSSNISTGKFDLPNDQRFTGNLVSTIGTTYLYRAILNCTEELIAQLDSRGLYKKTLIQFGSEFNRSPKVNGSGSDHGYLGCSTLLMSGMINGTSVIGNIKDDTSPSYGGTWGLAANHPITGAEQLPLRINDVALTVAAMLELGSEDTITNNGVVLLEPKANGAWSPFAGARGEAKNV